MISLLIPDRSTLLTLRSAVRYPPVPFQKSFDKKQRICGACPHGVHVSPIFLARSIPWVNARCWLLMVKNDEPWTWENISRLPWRVPRFGGCLAVVVLELSWSKGKTDLFPQVIASLIPVLAYVLQIVQDNWPDCILHHRHLTFAEKVVAIVHQCYRPKSRPVSLRSPPVSIESRFVCVEFWLSQSKSSRIQCSRGIGDCLQDGLRAYVVVNEVLEGIIAENELVNEHSECQC
jgi:hypothetical protein